MVEEAETWVIYDVTGLEDSGAYYTFTVTHVANGGIALSDGRKIIMSLTEIGDSGTSGSSGASGTSGSSGIDGTSGSSGADGVDEARGHPDHDAVLRWPERPGDSRCPVGQLRGETGPRRYHFGYQ